MAFPVPRMPANRHGRDFVVGDIHGCFSKLSLELDRLEFDRHLDRLFSVGDLVDRGPESLAAIDWLDYPWFHAVRGNHEQMAIDYLAGSIHPDDYRLWGGAWFMELDHALQDRIAARFDALPIALEVETPFCLVGIVHADCPFASWNAMVSELKGEDALPIAELCLASRERLLSTDESGVDGIARVYVGHTPVTRPMSLGNVHYIDTGAVFNRVLAITRIR